MKLLRKIKIIQTRIVSVFECDACEGKGTFHTASSGTMPDICSSCNGLGATDRVDSITETEQDMK